MTNHCFTAKNCPLFFQHRCLLCRPEPGGCPAVLRPVTCPRRPSGAALCFPDCPFLPFTARIRWPVQSALTNPHHSIISLSCSLFSVPHQMQEKVLWRLGERGGGWRATLPPMHVTQGRTVPFLQP